jgi:hypothetical protein
LVFLGPRNGHRDDTLLLMNTPSGILGRWTRRLGTWATLVGTCACSGASSSANQRCTAAPNTQAAAEGTPTECARADEAIRRAQAHLGQGHLVLAAQELELLEKDLKVEAPADLWRSLEVKARAGLNSTNDPTSAEHLLWRGIVAHIQHAQGDPSVARRLGA